ncbi:hypothetical protein [Pseudomonas aeruginosa]|uniref:hypothetical protein n=1 Tax=Pseudomonas aeruginosa TaxID=287 RepID=UPI003857ACFD
MADLTTTATGRRHHGPRPGRNPSGRRRHAVRRPARRLAGHRHEQDLKAWSRLLSLILPTCVGYLFADVALARVPWLTNLAFSAFVCALVVIPLSLKAGRLGRQGRLRRPLAPHPRGR